MSEVKVNRWRRYGHDRLYVSLADGTRLGWHDLRTGKATLERPEHRDEQQADLERLDDVVHHRVGLVGQPDEHHQRDARYHPVRLSQADQKQHAGNHRQQRIHPAHQRQPVDGAAGPLAEPVDAACYTEPGVHGEGG